MQQSAPTIALWQFLLLILPSSALAGSAFQLDAPSGPIVGVSIESDWQADGLLFVNRRGIAKQSFRPETTREPLRWVSRFGSVSFSMVGREFATTGINEAGLVVCALHLRASRAPRADERYPMDSASWVQYALDNCSTVAEVAAIDETVRLLDDDGISNHFFVADATGDCAVLEYLDGELVVYAGETLPLPVLTNMRYPKALEARERGGAPWWWANPDRSAERFAAAAEQIAAFDASGDAVGQVWEILSSAVTLPTTNWSIVYDLAQKRVFFRSARMTVIKQIELPRLDLSCTAPAMMSPIDAPPALSGWAPLFPYDPDRNLELFRGFLADHRIQVDEAESEGLMRFLESFGCAPAQMTE